MKEMPSDEDVRESFARQVALFSGVDSPFARPSSSPTSWVEPLDEQMIVLDVACGAGHVAEQIAPFVRQVVGLDLTPDLLRLGHDRLRGAGIDNILLQEGNAADLPFLDQSFDVVLCRSALHHFRSPEATTQEMSRVCRSGGRVVVSDMVAPSAELRVAFDDLHRVLDPSHMGVLLSEEIVTLLANEVGPIAFAELTGPFPIPLDRILSAVSDKAQVERALAAEVDGGERTGFNPEADSASGRISVSFTSASVQAIRN